MSSVLALDPSGSATGFEPEPACLDAALAYAVRGWGVVPVHTVRDGVCSCRRAARCRRPGKHPRIGRWQLEASVDPEQVSSWWATWPEANVGIVAGAHSRVLVIDVDPRNGGDATLLELEAALGALPDTVEAISGGDGRHVYFRYPERLGTVMGDALGPGLDVQADRKLVVAPPSLHKSGRRYEWEVSSHPDDVALADLPERWLARLCAAPARGARAESSDCASAHFPRSFRVLGGVPEGDRNNGIFRMALRLHAMKAPREVAEALGFFARYQSESRFPSAEVMTPDEVRSTVRSAYSYTVTATTSGRHEDSGHHHTVRAPSPQRLDVLDVVADSTQPMTPSQVAAKIPWLSYASVKKLLQRMERVGLLRRVSGGYVSVL